MQLLKNGTMALIASIFFQPQITCILWRNCLLRGVFQKNFHSQKKFMLIGRRAGPSSMTDSSLFILTTATRCPVPWAAMTVM